LSFSREFLQSLEIDEGEGLNRESESVVVGVDFEESWKVEESFSDARDDFRGIEGEGWNDESVALFRWCWRDLSPNGEGWIGG